MRTGRPIYTLPNIPRRSERKLNPNVKWTAKPGAEVKPKTEPESKSDANLLKMRSEKEADYQRRTTEADGRLAAARAAQKSAIANAPGCVTRSVWNPGGRNIENVQDCTAREGALMPYAVDVQAAEAGIQAIAQACQDDAYCMPYWAPPMKKR